MHSARVVVFVCLPLLASSCFGPRSIETANLSPQHVAWIAETAPQTGTWLSAIEGEDAWVDAFRDDAGWLIVIAHAKDPQRTAYLGAIPAIACDEWPEFEARKDSKLVSSDTHVAPTHVLESSRIVRVCQGCPRSGFLEVEVFMRDPATNSWPYADFCGRLEFDCDPHARSSFVSAR